MNELSINAGTSQPIIDSLHGQGFDFRTRMEIVQPSVPGDVTILDDSELMELFSELTAFSNFLSAQYACAQIDEKNAETDLERAESVVYLAANDLNKKETVAMLKARTMVDPNVRDCKERYNAVYAYRKLIEVMVNNAERSTILISRELTRRTAGATAMSRSQRMIP